MVTRFDETLGIGNILLIVTLIVSVTAAWIANRERTLDNQRNIAALAAEVDRLEIRVRSIEVGHRGTPT